jgi:hypothetical protein
MVYRYNQRSRTVFTPTPEEIQIVKDHFEGRGYGIISDEIAAAQKDLIKMIRSGSYPRKPDDTRTTS